MEIFSDRISCPEDRVTCCLSMINLCKAFVYGQEADGMEIFSDEEVPTEEMIERMEERLETATSQQKNLFLIIFQVWHLSLCLCT